MTASRELYLTGLFLLFSQISALQTGNSSKTACELSNVTIDFIFNLGNDTFLDRSWYKNSSVAANKIAGLDNSGSWIVESQYSGRVAFNGLGGITLYNVKKTDSENYLFVILTDIYSEDGTATTTVNIYVNPNTSCMPIIENNSAGNITCKISEACPGNDSIQAIWDDGSVGVFKCPSKPVKTKYNCCAKGDPVTYCFNGSLCSEIECNGTGTTTTNTTTVTSSSTSMSSTTTSVIIDNTSTKPTTNESASTTISTSSNITIGNISVTPATNESASATNNTSTSTKPTLSESTTINNTSTKPTISGSATINNTTSNKSKSDIDIKVIVPVVVVPCGLLIMGGIILVVCCVRRKREKNVCESPDGMAVQDKGNNTDEWKQSQGHGKATDNLDAVYTTPDGFVIFPGPAAMSSVRSYKKHHDGTDQYNRPYAVPYHHQAEHFPSTYTSAGAYTHKDKKHHGVTDQYSRPYAGAYGYQTAHIPSTYKSARTYPHKGRNYDYEGPIHQQASRLMDTSRPAYDQAAYYPQTGHYGQSSQDVYYSGGGQYSYGQKSRSHYHHSGRKQQREYYNQYEMADYEGNRVGYRHTKWDTAFYY